MRPLQLVATGDLEESINQLSLIAVAVASVLLVILIVLAIQATKRKKKRLKTPLFLAILIVVIGTTLTISGSTVYLNLASATGGPVHWHADVEFWACGNELELRDPIGALSNKIGTATLHEHNDKRIHLEGVPVSMPYDASLGKFMTVVGGEIGKDSLVVPLNGNDDLFENGKDEVDGDGSGNPAPDLVQPFIVDTKDGKAARFVSGETCGDQPAAVQVFVYKYNKTDKTYMQTKLSDPATYALSGEAEVPPGDCVIFEFSPSKDRTDKLCRQYGIRDLVKCDRFGVPANERGICQNTEVR